MSRWPVWVVQPTQPVPVQAARRRGPLVTGRHPVEVVPFRGQDCFSSGIDLGRSGADRHPRRLVVVIGAQGLCSRGQRRGHQQAGARRPTRTRWHAPAPTRRPFPSSIHGIRRYAPGPCQPEPGWTALAPTIRYRSTGLKLHAWLGGRRSRRTANGEGVLWTRSTRLRGASGMKERAISYVGEGRCRTLSSCLRCYDWPSREYEESPLCQSGLHGVWTRE